MNITCKNMSAGYGKNKILNDINLVINPGERVFIGGANGSGKTTLLRVLSGLIPHEGEVLIDGKEVSSMKRKDIAKLIALMPQTNEIYFPYTVNETVLLGTYATSGNSLFGTDPKSARFAIKCMEDCGVLEFKDRHLDELSSQAASSSAFFLLGLLRKNHCSFSLTNRATILISNTGLNSATNLIHGQQERPAI